MNRTTTNKNQQTKPKDDPSLIDDKALSKLALLVKLSPLAILIALFLILIFK